MRRVLLLLALLVLVIWLIKAKPQEAKTGLRSGWFYSRTATAPPSTVVPDPPCDGCDPNEEASCLYNGGSWDSNTCTCTYGCDPYAEQECYYEGGYWDPNSCTCDYPQCNPGEPEVVGVTEVEYWYCDGWDIWDCSGTWTDYEQYCWDGTLYSSWTEYTEFCYDTGDSCYGGCDPWTCCDYWYCS
jgi:hypothetical protein